MFNSKKAFDIIVETLSSIVSEWITDKCSYRGDLKYEELRNGKSFVTSKVHFTQASQHLSCVPDDLIEL